MGEFRAFGVHKGGLCIRGKRLRPLHSTEGNFFFQRVVASWLVLNTANTPYDYIFRVTGG